MVPKSRAERNTQVRSHIVCGIIAFIMAVPFVWMILSSFKPSAEVVRMPPTFFPENFTTKT